MSKTTRLLCLLAILTTPQASQAAELSPWLGAEGQAPFQLDPDTMVAVTFAADPLQTGSTSKRDCNLETCTLQPLTAKSSTLNP